MWRSLEKQDRRAKQREQSTAFQGAKILHGGIQRAKMQYKVRISKSKISHTTIQGAKIFAPCETPSWHTSVISHCLSQFSHSANQGAKISHTSIQGVKFIPTCENHSPRCEFSKRQFRTPLFKVQKFRTVRNTLLAHEWHFAHPKPNFAPCETRCEIECETPFKVQNSQFKVRKFRTIQFKVRTFRMVKF